MKGDGVLTIIIPVLSVTDEVKQLCERLIQSLDCEIILSQAKGSESETNKIGDDNITDDISIVGVRVICEARGRGAQLKAGAQYAMGVQSDKGAISDESTQSIKANWLLFMHGDSIIDERWCEAVRAHMQGNGQRAAYFKLRFDDQGWRPRLLERLVALRCRLFALPYGDQAMLISRTLYERVGGYKDMPLMEDVDLVKRLGRGQLQSYRQVITTSAERYQRAGYFSRIIKNSYCLYLYFTATPIEKIKKVYE